MRLSIKPGFLAFFGALLFPLPFVSFGFACAGTSLFGESLRRGGMSSSIRGAIHCLILGHSILLAIDEGCVVVLGVGVESLRS